jgi:hypothetical protein
VGCFWDHFSVLFRFSRFICHASRNIAWLTLSRAWIRKWTARTVRLLKGAYVHFSIHRFHDDPRLFGKPSGLCSPMNWVVAQEWNNWLFVVRRTAEPKHLGVDYIPHTHISYDDHHW